MSTILYGARDLANIIVAASNTAYGMRDRAFTNELCKGLVEYSKFNSDAYSRNYNEPVDPVTLYELKDMVDQIGSNADIKEANTMARLMRYNSYYDSDALLPSEVLDTLLTIILALTNE